MVVVDFEPLGRVCKEGLWFNFNQQRCTLPYETTCQLDGVVCFGVENERSIQAPNDCSDFVTCINGRPFAG